MMNIELATAIAQRTNTSVSELMDKSFEVVAWEVLLPVLAGRPHPRTGIYPEYMSFMAEWGEKCMEEDPTVGSVLYEIAMQRISDGAVLHQDDSIPTATALPNAYRDYGSCVEYFGGKPGPMDEECYNFLVKQLENCWNIPNYKYHAKVISFGIVRYLNPDGTPLEDYVFGSVDFEPDGSRLYQLAYDLIMKYADDEDIFGRWAQKGQWQRHIHYFARKWRDGELDFKRFLEFIGVNKEGFWERRRQRRYIKRLFEKAVK